MELSEAEIQVLASLDKARVENTGIDKASLESSGERFWIFLENWSDAFPSLAAKGLIEDTGQGFRLTQAGGPLAQDYNRERVDLYWYYYQKFYAAASASAAHSRLCECVFGEDLCQEGQTNMAALNDLLDILDLKSGEHVFDLGCGAGVIDAYISERTGARVTGIDNSTPAIAEANRRNEGKQSLLTFVQGDMNAIDLAAGSLDSVISLDTLYWAADLDETLSQLAAAVRPGGRMGLFMNHHIKVGDDPGELALECTALYKSLSGLGLRFETKDYTVNICNFWHKVLKAAKNLQTAFEAEGNGFIAASLIRESEEVYLPDVEAGRIARYLYHVRL